MLKLVFPILGLLLTQLCPAVAEGQTSDISNTACEEISRRAVSSEKHRKKNNNSRKDAAVLSPHECWKHIGEQVSVRFKIDNTHECRKGHVYLNESTDYKRCFAAIISTQGRKLFAADIDSSYKGQTVTVTRVLEMYGGTPKIVLDKPEQLKVSQCE